MITNNMDDSVAKKVSKYINSYCIYAQLFDGDFYVLSLYNGGKYITGITKGEYQAYGIAGKRLDRNKLYDIIPLDEIHMNKLEEAIKCEDVEDSFYKLEEVFDAILTIDFNHMDKEEMKEYENLGGKWHII